MNVTEVDSATGKATGEAEAMAEPAPANGLIVGEAVIRAWSAVHP